MNKPNPPPDWVAAPLPPKPGPPERHVALKRLARRARAAAALASPRNIAKGLRLIARGEFGLLVASFRNLMAQRLAVLHAARPVAVEHFQPAPDMPALLEPAPDMPALLEPAPDMLALFEPAPDTPGAPLVSIIIPCFNDGLYVHETVASALAQSFTDIEVIIVDGGSTDGTTPDIVAALSGPRVRTLIRTDGRHLPG